MPWGPLDKLYNKLNGLTPEFKEDKPPDWERQHAEFERQHAVRDPEREAILFGHQHRTPLGEQLARDGEHDESGNRRPFAGRNNRQPEPEPQQPQYPQQYPQQPQQGGAGMLPPVQGGGTSEFAPRGRDGGPQFTEIQIDDVNDVRWVVNPQTGEMHASLVSGMSYEDACRASQTVLAHNRARHGGR